MKLHRKLKHNEKVCHAHKLGTHNQGQGHSQGSEVKLAFCNKLKPAEANTQRLIIIRRYVTHNIYIPKLNVRVTICSQRSNTSAVALKSTKANMINIHR